MPSAAPAGSAPSKRAALRRRVDGAAQPNEPALAATTTAPVFTPEVQRVTLKDGDFTFLDAAGRVVAKFIGLDFRSSFRTATAIKGSAQVDKISLRDRFFIENLESPLHYEPEELSFSNISAEAAGGSISGRFEMELQTPDSPFTAEVKFRDLQAEKLLTNAGGPAGMIQGRVEGFLDATGKTADSNALTGHGEIVLRDGKLQQYSLLVALGQILQIDELMQLHLEQAEIKYHISPGIVTIDQLLLRSPNIRLTATGTISFRGKLRLDSQLALNDKVRRQLFGPIRENFQPLQEPAGYAAVDFKVSGTVDRPKTDLMDKLVGRDLRDLGGVISSLFGHGKRKKNRPKKRLRLTTSAEPAVAAPDKTATAPEQASAAPPAHAVPHALAHALSLRHESDRRHLRRHPARRPENRYSTDDGPGQSRHLFQPRRARHRRACARSFCRHRRARDRGAQSRRGFRHVRGERSPGHRRDRAQSCPHRFERTHSQTGRLRFSQSRQHRSGA